MLSDGNLNSVMWSGRLEAALRPPKTAPNVAKKMKTSFALVRQPCDSANSHEGLEVSHEIQRFFSLKCDRIQVYGCYKADLK